MSMPGIARNVPRWLFDPLGPLSIHWRYLPMLAPWLVRFLCAGKQDRVEATARALRRLLQPCLDILTPLVRDAGIEDLIHRQGGLFVYRSREALAKNNAGYLLRRRNGVLCEELGANEIRELEPRLSPEYQCGVLIRENSHTSNPHRLVTGLASAFVRSGGTILRRKALGFVLDREKLRAVRTDEGELAGEFAVLAAGVHSRFLARMLGDSVPLQSERGYHLMIRNPEVATRMSVMDGVGKFVATPMETGLCIAGTVELASLDAPPNWNRARVLMTHGQRMLPGMPSRYDPDRMSMWMGHRPSLPDSLPVIGRSRRAANVLYAFGHGHVGMVAAPMTGRVIADLVAGRDPEIDITPFRADRF
jgi:D-amino-acid dehydrogenase